VGATSIEAAGYECPTCEGVGLVTPDKLLPPQGGGAGGGFIEKGSPFRWI
jgi:hypothetical protein